MNNEVNEYPEKPYVGATVIKDARLFYGRKTETDAVVDSLLAYRLILLFSPSGAGKSSLIEAGVKPKLTNDFTILPTIRLNRKPNPGQIPEGISYNRFTVSALLSLQDEKEIQAQELQMNLEKVSLREYLEKHFPNGENTGRILFIFDQFEELLTSDLTAKDEMAGFLADLMKVLYDYRYWAIFSMREDYLAQLEPYLSYFPDRLSTHYYLKLLSKDAAASAIICPAKLCEVDFEDGAAEKLVNDLSTKRIPGVSGVVEQPGDYIEPVQLQVVCANFWDDWKKKNPDRKLIKITDLPSLADIDDALANHYDRKVTEVITTLKIDELGVRDWFEKELITNQNFRQQSLAGKEIQYGLTGEAIKMLMDGYLVREDTRLGTTWYELAHDRLIQPVINSNTRWYNENLPQLLKTVRNWVKENWPDDYLLSGDRLEQSKEWVKQNRNRVDADVDLFLEKSQLEEDKRIREFKRVRQRDLFIIAGISGVIIFITICLAFLFMYRQSVLEGREARYNLSGQYGAKSQSIPASQARKKLAEGIRALAVTTKFGEYESSEARHAAYDAIASTGIYPVNSEYLLKDELKDITALSSSPGERLAVATAERIYIWDEQQFTEAVTQSHHSFPKTKYEIDTNGEISSLALSPDGNWLVAGGYFDGSGIRLWDLSTGDIVETSLERSNLGGNILAVKFSPGGYWLAATGDDGTVQLWKGDFLGKPFVLQRHESAVRSVDFSKDEHWLASGGDDGMLILWDLTNDNLTKGGKVLPDHGAAITALAFSPNGPWLAVGSGDGTARLWNTTASEPGQGYISLEGLTASSVNILAFHQNGLWLAQANADQSVCLYSLKEFNNHGAATKSIHCNIFQGNPTNVFALSFDPLTDLLAFGDVNGDVQLWRYADNRLQTLPNLSSPVFGIIFDPRRSWMMTVNNNGELYLWGMENSSRISLPLSLPAVESAGFTKLSTTPDGRYLIGLDAEGKLHHWKFDDIDNELNNLSLYKNPERQAKLVSYSGYLNGEEAQNVQQAVIQSNWLATSNQSGIISLWNLEQEDPIPQNLDEDLIQVNSLAFSPAGDLLAAGGSTGDPSNNAIQLWQITPSIDRSEVASHSLKHLPVETPTVYKVIFSPDQRWLAAGGENGFLCLWDLQNGLEAATPVNLSGDEAAISQIVFIPKWGELASGSKDGRVRFWLLQDPSQSPKLLPVYATELSGPTDRKLLDNQVSMTELNMSPDGRWLVASNKISNRVWLIDTIIASQDSIPDDINETEQGKEGYHKLSCSQAGTDAVSFIQEISVQSAPINWLGKWINTKLNLEDDLPAGTTRWLAIMNNIGDVCLWDLRDPLNAPIVFDYNPPSIVTGSNENVTDFAGITANPQGTWFASASPEGQIMIWPLNIHIIDNLACSAYIDYVDKVTSKQTDPIYQCCKSAFSKNACGLMK